MKKIIFIANNAMLNGGTLSMLELIKGLRGHVEFIAIFPGAGPMVTEIETLDVRYMIVRFLKINGKPEQYADEIRDEVFMDSYEAAKEIFYRFQDEKIDLIHTNSSLDNVGAMLSLLFKVPHIWHIRELLQEHFESCFLEENLKKDLFAVSSFITVSGYVQKAFREKYNIESYQLYDPVRYSQNYRPITEKNLTKERLHNILFAGAVTKQKGQLDAVRAIEILASKGFTSLHLYLVGDGSSALRWLLDQYLKKHSLEDKISMIPYQKDLSDYREKCGISLTCSKAEGMGRVTVEAMQAGMVVIGANTGATLELIGSAEERGFLYQQGNAHDLASVICKVLEMEPELLCAKVRMAQAFSEKEFSTKIYANLLYSLYQSVADTYCETDSRKMITEKLELRYHNIKNKWLHDCRPGCILNSSYIMEGKKVSLEERSIATIVIALRELLQKEKIKSIAIYGMEKMGVNLYQELEGSEVEVRYVMDKKFDQIADDMITDKVRRTFENVADIDALVISIEKDEKILREKYEKMGILRILSLADV